MQENGTEETREGSPFEVATPQPVEGVDEVVLQRMLRVAEYLKVDGGRLLGYEEDNPLAATVWILAHTALASLRHYIDDPAEPEITWDSPWVEARLPVAWDWERDEPCFLSLRREDFEGEINDVADRLGERLGDCVRGWAAHFLTHRLIFRRREEVVESYLPLEDLERLALLDHDSRDYFVRLVERPITILGDRRDPEATFAEAVLADGSEQFNRCSAVQLTITATEDDGETVIGQAYPIVQVHPLVVDEVERVAYFPMVAAIVADEPMAARMAESSEDSLAFWERTFGVIGEWIAAASRPVVPNGRRPIPAEVDEAFVEKRLVVVPRTAEAQLEVVRKVRGFALTLAGRIELGGSPNDIVVSDASSPVGRPRVTLPPGTNWKQLSLVFTAKDTVRIETSSGFSRVYTFGELGFRDNRTDGRHDSRWGLLWSLARRGEISWRQPAEKMNVDRVKAAIGDLRRRLKQVFGIDEDPFLRYRSVKAYRAKFTLRLDDRLAKDVVGEGELEGSSEE